MTFLIEDYYKEENQLTNFAVCNIIASLYDPLIKLAEAFDECSYFIETGVWCKKSILAHKSKLTATIALPLTTNNLSRTQQLQKPTIHLPRQQKIQHTSGLEEISEIVAETKVPCLWILSTSLDKKICLWDKVWIFTAVPAENLEDTLDEILDMHWNPCTFNNWFDTAQYVSQ